MPEVIFNGPAGRLEGRYQPSKEKSAPDRDHPAPASAVRRHDEQPDRIPALLHVPEARFHDTFRFNFRGIGPQPGANSTMAPASCPMPPRLSTGCRACIPIRRAAGWPVIPSARWIGMQLLMRRPEIEGFHVDRAAAEYLRLPPSSPSCPSSRPDHQRRYGQGGGRRKTSTGLVEKLKTQKGILITHRTVEGANHFFNAQGGHADGRVRGLSRPPPRRRTGAGTAAAKRIR